MLSITRLLLFLLLLIGTAGKGHNLTLENLIFISKKQNWEDVNEYLTKKGWEYFSSKKGDILYYNTITWSYNKNSWDDRAESWFLLYTYEGLPNKISYNVNSKSDYNLIFNALSSNGFKKSKSEILDDILLTTYVNSSHYITVSTEKTESNYSSGSHTSYTFELVNKSSVYDPENGSKVDYFSNGKLKSKINLKDGKLNGECIYYYETGKISSIENYLNGIANGNFKFYDKEGKLTKECNYKNNLLNGDFMVVFDDGSWSKGVFLNDKKHGLFADFDKYGVLEYEHTYKNDIETGPFRVYDLGVLTVEGNLIDGKKNGIYKEYYLDGSLKTEGIFKNDLRHGFWKAYFPNGNINSAKTFAFDELSGPYKEYDSDGELVFEGSAINGKSDGVCKWYESGKISLEATFKIGISNGPYSTYYYEKDVLIAKESGSYIDGELDGPLQMIRINNGVSEIVSSITYINGKRNGASQSLNGDSLVFAEYKDDVLNGLFLVYTGTGYNSERNVFSTITIDTSKLDLILIGNCLNGKYHGNVKYFEEGLLTSNGNFIAGQKDGCWNYYYSPYFKSLDNPFKGELFLTECYKNGLLHGHSIRYSGLYIIEENTNNSETFKPKIAKNETYYESNFLEDRLHGRYFEKDTTGVILQEGNYSYGKKHGNWTERTKLDDGTLITCRGNYNEGFEEGEWMFYQNETELRDRIQYKKGQIDGMWIVYFDDATETIRMELTFEQNKLKIAEVYDGKPNPIKSFEILDYDKNSFTILITEYLAEKRILSTYKSEESLEEISFHFFDVAIEASIYSGKTKKYGDYKEYQSGNLIVQGQYENDIKIGSWGLHYIDQNITLVEDYKNGKLENETYYEYNSNNLFKGTFEYTNPNTGLVQKRKIKDGLRNGKTTYYGSSGEVIKKEHYINGVLQ